MTTKRFKSIIRIFANFSSKTMYAGFLQIPRPHQGTLRLSGPPSGQGAGGGARTRDRRIPAELKADSPLCHQRHVIPRSRVHRPAGQRGEDEENTAENDVYRNERVGDDNRRESSRERTSAERWAGPGKEMRPNEETQRTDNLNLLMKENWGQESEKMHGHFRGKQSRYIVIKKTTEKELSVWSQRQEKRRGEDEKNVRKVNRERSCDKYRGKT
ncbi:hypothetical protein PoB_004454000 [Plakobranchus ocellatus]|uniref:Uncharacterized protein n=1 Tax=Plakobranchus ocellatus TaxID=259542 RepID=A0AAV4BEQ4_9GAST|nr:hypothetical protein PoB_004454000 [Plakobranchus ocellatus]